MFLAMKVLPALNVEEVECTLDDGEFSIGDFLIEGGDANWEKMYPLTVTYLKSNVQSGRENHELLENELTKEEYKCRQFF